MTGAGVVLTEGGVVERIRRHASARLDPDIAHAGLVLEEPGRQALREIYDEYLDIGQRHDLPFLSLTPTWRANPERMARSAFAGAGDLNGACVGFLQALRQRRGAYASRILIGGLMGCRGDAYRPGEALSSAEAADFHRQQAEKLTAGGVDFIKVATLPAISEAHGIAVALSRLPVPCVLSFVVRANGTLLDQTPLHQAIDRIDSTVRPCPLFYMINCVHPTVCRAAIAHERQVSPGIVDRLRGIQANTSALSPEELERIDHLDTAEPEEFADQVVNLHREHGLKVLGGCCGSDGRHIAAIAERVGRQHG